MVGPQQSREGGGALGSSRPFPWATLPGKVDARRTPDDRCRTTVSDLSLNYSCPWKRLFSGDLFVRELRRICLDTARSVQYFLTLININEFSKLFCVVSVGMRQR